MSYAPFVRIALRYGAMFLVSKGLFDASLGNQLTNDAELIAVIEMVVGGIVAAVTEIWHAVELKRAKKDVQDN